jgi:alkylation response protein AidB-like acyl-CoA dehydrogenase
MATKIEAAELLLREAADLKNAGKPCTKISAMAKYYASEISVQVSTDAVQILVDMVIQGFPGREILSRQQALYYWRRHIGDSEDGDCTGDCEGIVTM